MRRTLRPYASLSSSVRYLGAIAFTFSMNAACSFSLSFGGGVVRVATGSPTSTKNFSFGRTNTEHAYGLTGGVVKLMGSFGRDVQRYSGAENRLRAPESC